MPKKNGKNGNSVVNLGAAGAAGLAFTTLPFKPAGSGLIESAKKIEKLGKKLTKKGN